MGGQKPSSYKQFSGVAAGCDVFGGPPAEGQSWSYMASEQLMCFTSADVTDGDEADNHKVFAGLYDIPAGAPPGTIGYHDRAFGTMLTNGCMLSADAAVDLFTNGAPAPGSLAATRAAMEATIPYATANYHSG
jgi:hypothetical protein